MPMIDSNIFKKEMSSANAARQEYNAACDTARTKAQMRDRDPEGFRRAEELMYEKGRIVTNAEIALAHAVIREVSQRTRDAEAAAKA